MSSIKRDGNIILKKSDKGGRWIIMNKDYYINHIVKEDPLKNFIYKEINRNTYKIVFENLNQFIRNYKHCFTEKEIDYLTNYD